MLIGSMPLLLLLAALAGNTAPSLIRREEDPADAAEKKELLDKRAVGKRMSSIKHCGCGREEELLAKRAVDKTMSSIKCWGSGREE